jgi:hypothetical protein
VSQDPNEQAGGTTAHGDAAPRTLVLHDVNGHAFALLPQLRQLLGERFSHIEDGDAPRSESDAHGKKGAPENPHPHRVICDARVIPVLLKNHDPRWRRFLPVAHPVLRCLQQIEVSARADAGDAGAALPDPGLVRSIAARLPDRMATYPASNFHVGFLLGKAQRVRTDEALAVAERAPEAFGVGLADFPSTIQAQLMAELMGVGAPLQGSVTMKFDGDTKAINALRAWQEALPAPAFRELCRINGPDLVFFDRVAISVCDRLALTDAERKRILQSIDALASITGHRTQRRGTDVAKALPAKPQLFEPDPVLGWRLKPGGTRDYMRGEERIIMEVNAEGCRPVPGQPLIGEKTFAAYGCSCVFGECVAIGDTFCAELQRKLPSWRVENHGVGNFGEIHCFLQLSRALRWNRPDYVMFGWIPGHLARNVADLRWIQANSAKEAFRRNQHHWSTPRAYLNQEGKLQHRMVAFHRTDLAEIDMRDYANDGYYMDQICFAIVERSAEIVRKAGGHFFLITLLGALSVRLAGLIANAGIPVIDASVSGRDYIAQDGHHPGPRAHQHYAETIHRYLTQHAKSVAT